MNYLGQNKKVHGLPFGLSTAHKMKFSIKDLFCKCDQIRRKLRIWSHLLKKSLIENFTFCAVPHWTHAQKRIQSSVKHLTWIFLRKPLTIVAKSFILEI